MRHLFRFGRLTTSALLFSLILFSVVQLGSLDVNADGVPEVPVIVSSGIAGIHAAPQRTVEHCSPAMPVSLVVPSNPSQLGPMSVFNSKLRHPKIPALSLRC